MDIVWGGSANPELRDEIAKFVASRIGADRGFGPCVTMGVVNGNRLIAGMVFHNYAPESGVIELSGASDSSRWLTRPVFKAMFSYPFEQAGCQMLVARHSERNARVRRMWRAVGAVEHIIPRLRGRDEAEVISTYTVETWREGKIMRGIH